MTEQEAPTKSADETNAAAGAATGAATDEPEAAVEAEAASVETDAGDSEQTAAAESPVAAAGDAEDGEPVSEEEPDPEPEIDPKDAEIAELKDKLLRAVAEVENIRRRGGREREEAHKFAVTRFARDLCEVADNLRRAIDSVPDDSADDAVGQNLMEGVRMTERVMHEVFSRHGIRQIDAAGERFDPNLHEAMTEIEAPDAAPGTVVQVFQTGYVINDRLLRPARVIIAKGASKTPGESVDTVA